MDVRREWLRFTLVVAGSAIGGFGVAVLVSAAVARIIGNSIDQHLR